MKKIGSLLFLLVFSFSSFVWAENQTKVQVLVDRDQMGIGDSFTLVVRVISNEDFEMQEPQMPTLESIEILNSWAGSQSTSSRVQFINGKSSFEKTVTQDFNYLLSPQKEGKLVIPVIDVTVNGKTYKTQPAKIDVAEEYRGGGGRAQKGNQGRGRVLPGFDDEDPFMDDDDPFSAMLKRQQEMLEQMRRGMGGGGSGFPGTYGGPIPERKLDINTREAFFVYLDVDKTEVYEGQQITANWYIYVKGQIESLDRAKFPNLTGFWKEIIEEVPSLQFSPEIVNGVTYQKALLASHALFPIKPGFATIDEFKIKARTRMMTPNGLGQSNEWTKSSRRTSIKVLPLPKEGRPANFSGAVGSFQARLKTEGLKFPANQPFTVKLRFEGSGNAKLIELPTIQWPQGLEVFDTKSEAKFFKNGQSYKEFEILLVPKKEGEITIPAISFAHFNPDQKQYITTETDPVTLTITPGQAQANGGSSSFNPSNTGGAPATATMNSVQPQIELPQAGFISQEARWDIYLAVFAMTVLGMIFYFTQQLRSLDQAPSLNLIVERKMKAIQSSVQSKNFRHVGVEGVNLVYSIAAYLSGERSANLEWGALIEKVPTKLKEKYLDRLSKTFDYFQLLGFSPDNVHDNIVASGATLKEIEGLKKLADEISEELKSIEKE